MEARGQLLEVVFLTVLVPGVELRWSVLAASTFHLLACLTSLRQESSLPPLSRCADVTVPSDPPRGVKADYQLQWAPFCRLTPATAETSLAMFFLISSELAVAGIMPLSQVLL